MLKIKSQKIVPNVPSESTKNSFVLTSQEIQEHSLEWEFFAVFDFETTTSINSLVATNIVTDTFMHALILDKTDSVLQVLEKSLKECKEILQKMAPDTVFNAVVGVTKSDFVYISIYGDSKALYLDGTQVVHVSTAKEGSYASATQKIDDGRVMVLCTKSFFDRFPPQSLVSLTKPISVQDLDELSSAVIIKIDREKAEVATVESKEIKEISSKRVLENPKYLKPTLIAVAVLVLIVAGVFAIKMIKNRKIPQVNTNNVVVEVDNEPQRQGEPKKSDQQIQGELSKQLDEANKVRRVSAQVFYDLSIADAKAVPTELALGQNYLATCDPKQGKIYVSSKQVTKFEELPQLFPGVKNLLFEGDTLIFTDNEGVKYYTLATKAVSKSYLMDAGYSTLGPANEYLGFTYAVSGERLVKFAKATNKLSGSLWAQESKFAQVVSIDIDGNIYLLFANGDLEKYTGGTKADFAIVGLDKPIQKPLKVVTNADYKQIYVGDGDGEEGRIVAFDEDGVMAFQLKPQLGSEWTNLKSFDISGDEKTFYVLAGTKVFEFGL